MRSVEIIGAGLPRHPVSGTAVVQGLSRDGGARQGRILSLDFIRGFAVLAILAANIVGFANPMLATVWPGAMSVPVRPVDEAVWWIQFLLIEGKMRGLFTLLFGAGMALFLENRPGTLQARRLGWLMLFGLFHYFVLFRGDILFSYAVCGLIVLGLGSARLGAATLIITGIALYCVGALISSAMYLGFLVQENAALAACADTAACLAKPGDSAYWQGLAGQLADAARESAAYRGSFAELLAYNFREHLAGPVDAAVLALFETFPLILIGMGLLKHGFFERSGSVALGWGLFGIALGTALSIPLGLWIETAGFPLYRIFVTSLGPAQLARLPAIIGLAACLVWMTPRVAETWLGRRLIAAGRMAFSNYIGCSLLMAFLFQGWGLGWYGSLSRTELLWPMLVIWLAMLLWSHAWLSWYRFGPLEWLWRRLTYQDLMPKQRA